MLPTFVVIGAMKTGSSSFATYLGAHPAIFMSTPKEPSYFSIRWRRGQPWYESLFDDAGHAAARPVACASMRPATTLAIGLLLLAILVAGVIALTRI